MKELFSDSTRKFSYHETPLSDWRRFFRFPTDTLQISKRSYGIRSCAAGMAEDSGPINWSMTRVENWLRSDLIPGITQHRSPFVAFAVGEPGSGKSSFFKYLVNVYRKEFNDNKIVVSRFEAGKFRRRVRDLILSVAYRQDVNGSFSRLTDGAFASRESMDLLLEEVQTGPTNSKGGLLDSRYDAFAGLDGALQPSWINHRALDRVPHSYRLRILELYAMECAYFIIFDGLDHFSVEDNVFDPGNFAILKLLVNSFALFGSRSLVDKVSLPIRVNSIFVLRRNTHTRIMEQVDSDQQLPPIRTLEIAPIKPEVVMSNAMTQLSGNESMSLLTWHCDISIYRWDSTVENTEFCAYLTETSELRSNTLEGC